MKYVKVVITKKIADGRYDFVYPDGYDSKKIMVDGYEHRIDPSKVGQSEFLLGVADDSFPETDSITAMPKEGYDIARAAITPAA